jgi:hypothetical protein
MIGKMRFKVNLSLKTKTKNGGETPVNVTNCAE